MAQSPALDQDDSFDFLFKIVLIGDAGVGKTCVVQRFKSGTFLERHGSTIGVDFTMKTLTIDGKRLKVVIALFLDQFRGLVSNSGPPNFRSIHFRVRVRLS